MHKTVITKSFNIGKLRDFVDPQTILNETKYIKQPWWLSAGTALGFYRDGDFIKDDTDFDIGVLAHKGQQPIEIPTLQEFRRLMVGEYLIQQAFQDKRGVILDIYFYYEDVYPGKFFTISEMGGIIQTPFETKNRQTKYGSFPFPHPIEDYLEESYQNWKEPSGDKGRHVPIQSVKHYMES